MRSARASRNGRRSEARTRTAPEARAIAMLNSPTGPQPRTATDFADDVGVAQGEHRVAERLLQRRDLGRQLRAVVLPDHRLRHGDVLREGAVAVDAEYLRALAHVCLPRAAMEAVAARDVALGRDVVADRDVANASPDVDDGPGELVPERQRRRDALLRPGVPVHDVEVGAANARSLDEDEDLVVGRRRDRHFVEDEARLGGALADGPHRAPCAHDARPLQRPPSAAGRNPAAAFPQTVVARTSSPGTTAASATAASARPYVQPWTARTPVTISQALHASAA